MSPFLVRKITKTIKSVKMKHPFRIQEVTFSLKPHKHKKKGYIYF